VGEKLTLLVGMAAPQFLSITFWDIVVPTDSQPSS